MEKFRKQLAELRKLYLPVSKYAIFGSGPLAIRELRDSDDIDIVVKADLWNELLRKYPLANDHMIKIGSIEVYKQWLPWFNDVNRLIDSADIIEGTRFVSLNNVITWKTAMARSKDIKDLKLINDYINRG